MGQHTFLMVASRRLRSRDNSGPDDQIVVNGANSGNRLGGYAGRRFLDLGMDHTPKLHYANLNNDIELPRFRPRLLIQPRFDFLPHRRVICRLLCAGL